MIEPTLMLQSAVRSHLVADPAITALVPADLIRSGSTRPAKLPTIVVGDGRNVMHGRASGVQFVAGVWLDLHIWAQEDGHDRAKTIGAAVARRLMAWPATSGFELDEFKHIRTVWPRDPDPDYGHGVLSVEAVVRWKL